MYPNKKMSLAVYGKNEYKEAGSLSRLLCPSSVLADLDRDNSVRPEGDQVSVEMAMKEVAGIEV
ncbi:hypothetical protein DPV78_005728 [Talaromyces pinophilus]|nr:hypothetical protein DPV78_005728 [Talaromyces pinophilus]